MHISPKYRPILLMANLVDTCSLFKAKRRNAYLQVCQTPMGFVYTCTSSHVANESKKLQLVDRAIIVSVKTEGMALVDAGD